MLGCVLSLASVALAAEPSPPVEPTLSPPVGLADRLLAESSSAAEAARRWLREYLSDEAVDGYARSAQQAVIDRFECALNTCRDEHAATIGLFSFVPTCQTPSGAWARLGPGVSLPGRVVVLIHGLDEGGTIWDNAAPPLSSAGYTLLRFNYPNDQHIPHSADALAEALRELRERGVRSVTIVGHSMGGLVARDVLTRPAHYHGDARGNDEFPAVTRLIMLGTPQHGSALASLRGVMEVRDQFIRWMSSEHKCSAGLLGCMVDGEGEAGEDLIPGSDFLTELNSRPLPTHVEMTVVIGKVAAGSHENVLDALNSPYVVRAIGKERADAWKCGAESVWGCVGDGVVPDESARLEGVRDTVLVEADHRSMIRVLEPLEAARKSLGMENPQPPAVAIILDRLARDAAIR